MRKTKSHLYSSPVTYMYIYTHIVVFYLKTSKYYFIQSWVDMSSYVNYLAERANSIKTAQVCFQPRKMIF